MYSVLIANSAGFLYCYVKAQHDNNWNHGIGYQSSASKLFGDGDTFSVSSNKLDERINPGILLRTCGLAILPILLLLE